MTQHITMDFPLRRKTNNRDKCPYLDGTNVPISTGHLSIAIQLIIGYDEHNLSAKKFTALRA